MGCSANVATAPGVHVRGRTHLERHAPVAHECGQPAEVHRPVIADGDVVDDAHAVPQPLGATPLERLPDGRQAEALTGMDGDVEVLPTDGLEGVEVARRRVALLRPGDVEADDAGVTPAQGQLGDLARARELAHAGAEHLHDDRPTDGRRAAGADREALEGRLDHLVERQAALGRELRCIADLGIGDAIRGQVLGALGGHADDGVALLHHRHGVREGLEVQLERLAVGARVGSRPPSSSGSVRRQTSVAMLRREVDHGLRSQAAVEVVVEQDLGRATDRLGRQHRHMLAPSAGARDRSRVRLRARSA